VLKKIIAIPDIQAPKHDERAVATALKIVKGEKPDVLIHVGDFVDLQSVAKFKPKDWAEVTQTADQEIKAGNKILDEFDKVTPRKTEKVFLEGNHDRRLELWFCQYGAKLGKDFEGNSVQSQLRLSERGYKYIRTRDQPYKIGKAGLIHGWYANQYHAKKTIEKGAQNLIYGHTHDFQVHTGCHLDKDAPRLAMSIGCLCKFRQPYKEGKPTNWIHGVGLFWIDEKSGRFWPYFCPIINGEAVINGKKYKAS